MRLKTTAILLLALATNIGVCAQTRGTSSKSTGKARTTATIKQSTTKAKSATPKSPYPQGTIATMTIGKDKIYLMSSGKVTSSNQNIFGSWTIDSSYKAGIVKILNRKYDGETVYAIREEEEAYEVFAGSEGEVSIASPYDVIVKSEAGEEIVDFYNLPSIPVTWLRNDIRPVKRY